MNTQDADNNARLVHEAKAFDAQIRERVAHGHVPDLRHGERCEWFQNNLWRDPLYVDLTFGRIVRGVLAALARHAPAPARILEVGCGPGHVALELARAGHMVDALDISPACIEVAEQTRRRRPEDSGLSLRYHCTALEAFTPAAPVDAVVFVGSLHHFSNPAGALQAVHAMLAPGGLVFASEPVRHEFTRADAAIIHVLRVLLSQAGLYFEEQPVPDSAEALDHALAVIQRQVGYTDEHHNKTQSPNDNDCTFADIQHAAATLFDILSIDHDYAFIDCILGGLRAATPAQEATLATWLARVDECLVQGGRIRPRQGHLLARKRAGRGDA